VNLDILGSCNWDSAHLIRVTLAAITVIEGEEHFITFRVTFSIALCPS
jgi:hypothetical protein